MELSVNSQLDNKINKFNYMWMIKFPRRTLTSSQTADIKQRQSKCCFFMTSLPIYVLIVSKALLKKHTGKITSAGQSSFSVSRGGGGESDKQ